LVSNVLLCWALVRVISAGVAADYGIDVWSAGVTAFELWFDGKWIVDRTFAEDGAVIMPSGISNGSDVDDITGLTLAELHVLKVCLDVHDSTGKGREIVPNDVGAQPKRSRQHFRLPFAFAVY
jgi:hypothetical protein